MFKKVVLKFPRITVTVSEHFVTIYPTSNEPYSKPYTPQELQQWLNEKSILKEYPINSKTIKQLETLLSQIQKSTVKKSLKKSTLVKNHNTDEQEHVNFANKAIDKVENEPPNKEIKADQKLLESLPPSESPENVPVQEPNIIEAESKKTTVLPLKDAIVKQPNFMTIKKRHHDIINAVIVSHKKPVSRFKIKMIISTFKIILTKDKKTGENWIWINNTQRLTPKQFLQLMQSISQYIVDKEPVEETEYRIMDGRLFMPGSIPVMIDDSLIETLKQFSIENKEILLQK